MFSSADKIISTHHERYKIVTELIRNILLSESEGVNYQNWVDAVNEYYINQEKTPVLTGNDIFDMLEIDKSATTHFNDNKNLNVVEILNNYAEFKKVIAETLNTSVEITNDKWTMKSLFFDPISVMLFSKELLDQGYHVGQIDGIDRIIYTDINGVDFAIDMEHIKELIDTFNSKRDNFINGTFTNLLNGTSLGSLNSDTGELSNLPDIINMISLVYDFSTGEYEKQFNVDFNVGLVGFRDRNIWSQISMNAKIGSQMKDSKYNLKKKFLTYANFMKDPMKVAKAEALDLLDKAMARVDDYEDFTIRLGTTEEIIKGNIAYLRSGDNPWSNDRIIKYYENLLAVAKDEAKANSKVLEKAMKTVDSINATIKSLKNIMNDSNSTTKQILKAKKDLELQEAALDEAKIERDKAKENSDKDASKVKDADAVLKGVKEILNNLPSKMCNPEMSGTSDECGSGVGAAGDPIFILNKKAPKGLFDLLNENIRILKLPPQECNPITQICGYSNISTEITLMNLIV